MAPFSNLLAALVDVPDPRRAQGKRYPLPYLLMFTVLALPFNTAPFVVDFWTSVLLIALALPRPQRSG